MGNPCWVEKLRDNLTAFAGKTVSKMVMAGSEKLSELDEKKKAAWIKQALDKLDALVPDEAVRYSIMTECSCEPEGDIERLRAEYRKTQDIDHILELTYRNPFYVRPRREGNVIYFTKAPRHAEEFRKATTAKGKQYYYCHCDHVRATTERISRTHCFCSAGWYRKIWEEILQRPVKVVLLKSILQGDDVCEFAVHI